MNYEWGSGPPAATRSSIGRNALMGQKAFDEGRAYAAQRRSKYTAEEITASEREWAGAKDDYTKGFLKGLRDD
jgi:hypothetical protein